MDSKKREIKKVKLTKSQKPYNNRMNPDHTDKVIMTDNNSRNRLSDFEITSASTEPVPRLNNHDAMPSKKKMQNDTNFKPKRYKFIDDTYVDVYKKKQHSVPPVNAPRFAQNNFQHEYRQNFMQQTISEPILFEPPKKEKTVLEHIFDIINYDAYYFEKFWPLYAQEFSQKTAQEVLFAVVNYEGFKIKQEDDYYANMVNQNEKAKRKLSTGKKPRGRPQSISPEFASSEYNEQGIKVDFKKGEIDFAESLFRFEMEGTDKKFYCPVKICGKCFPSLSRAKRHYVTHTNLKVFKCENPDCDKAFSRKDNMIQHYRAHCAVTKRKHL